MIIPVSYTHLDVYKRQVSANEIYIFLSKIIHPVDARYRRPHGAALPQKARPASNVGVCRGKFPDQALKNPYHRLLLLEELTLIHIERDDADTVKVGTGLPGYVESHTGLDMLCEKDTPRVLSMPAGECFSLCPQLCRRVSSKGNVCLLYTSRCV